MAEAVEAKEDVGRAEKKGDSQDEQGLYRCVLPRRCQAANQSYTDLSG